MKRRLSGPVPYLGRFALLAQMLAAAGFVCLLLNAEGVRLPFTGAGDWTLQAEFSDAGGIRTRERTPVLVAGVPVGLVTSVRLDQGLAVVTMRLGASARGVVRTDATATIEPRSALEDMTVNISPGSPSASSAAPGAVIPSGRTLSSTTLDRVTAALDADTRTELSILLDQLARGIGGRGGELRSAVAELRALVDPATAVANALARRRVLISELVGALSRLGAAAEQHDISLARTLSAGATTLSVTAREQAAVAGGIRALPGTFSSLDRALGNVSALAAALVPTLSGLAGTADALPATLRSVRRVVAPAGLLLNAAAAFAQDARTGLGAAAGALRAIGGTAGALTPAIAGVEPIVAAVNDRRSGIGLLGERFSGVLSTDDANGPILRGLGTFEPFSPADFGFPSAAGTARALLAVRAAEALTLTCLHGQLVACLVRYLVPGLPGAVK